MERQAIKQYLDAVWQVVAEANRYFAGQEPWTKRKTDPERMGTILYVTAEVVRQDRHTGPTRGANRVQANCSTCSALQR